jgi:hypothetical protein
MQNADANGLHPGKRVLLTHQEAGRKGGRSHKAVRNSSGSDTREYMLARLLRDRPDLYAQVQARAKSLQPAGGCT